MVSLGPNPPEGYYLDPTGMALPGLGAFSAPTATAATSTPSSLEEDPNTKIRKPYTITKSRESWTEPEHDKFLEALQLFDRDWKKIVAFVGSKTVIQIRSHAQKYFMKVQKSGTNEHLPPPRPKRKAAHPYPQKASQNAPVLLQVSDSFQTKGLLPEPGTVLSSLVKNPVTNAAAPSWIDESVQMVSSSGLTKGDVKIMGQSLANNSCSSTENTTRAWPTIEMTDQGSQGPPLRVLPDFAQVYGFIGSVFDPNSDGQLQNLKKMDSIDVETVLLLMRNLSINLASPDFEEHRRLLSSYEIDVDQDIPGDTNVIPHDN